MKSMLAEPVFAHDTREPTGRGGWSSFLPPGRWQRATLPTARAALIAMRLLRRYVEKNSHEVQLAAP